jgi:hypothetical protein
MVYSADNKEFQYYKMLSRGYIHFRGNSIITFLLTLSIEIHIGNQSTNIYSNTYADATLKDWMESKYFPLLSTDKQIHSRKYISTGENDSYEPSTI